MSRVIKFRAWDKEQNFMEPDVHITYNPGGRHGIESLDSFLGDPKYVVMQYTGKNDSQGNNIYDEDIVRVSLEDDDMNTIWYEYTVTWCNEHACWELGKQHVTLHSFCLDDELQGVIIGNVYEGTKYESD